MKAETFLLETALTTRQSRTFRPIRIGTPRFEGQTGTPTNSIVTSRLKTHASSRPDVDDAKAVIIFDIATIAVLNVQ